MQMSKQRMKSGLQIRHYHRRANALAFHVRHDRQNRIRRERNEIIVVAADFKRRPVRNGHVKPFELRRPLGQEAELNTARKREIALHTLLVEQFSVKLRVFERQRYVIGDCPEHVFIGLRERPIVLIEELQYSDGLAVLIANGKAKNRASTKTKAKV